MPTYRDYTEWDSLKTRLKNRLDYRADDEHDRGGGIEELLDAAIRHRFGILISQSKLKLKARHR